MCIDSVPMNLIHLHPDDLAWMRRRLRQSTKVLLAMTLLSSLLQYSSNVPAQTRPPATGADVAIDFETSARRSSAPSSVKAETSEADQRPLNPVPPVGWRRTSQGWEHVSHWPTAPRSLNELIIDQRAEEPAWVQACFRQLGSVSPLAFAMFQISAVALIVTAAEIKRIAA